MENGYVLLLAIVIMSLPLIHQLYLQVAGLYLFRLLTLLMEHGRQDIIVYYCRQQLHQETQIMDMLGLGLSSGMYMVCQLNALPRDVHIRIIITPKKILLFM